MSKHAHAIERTIDKLGLLETAILQVRKDPGADVVLGAAELDGLRAILQDMVTELQGVIDADKAAAE